MNIFDFFEAPRRTIIHYSPVGTENIDIALEVDVTIFESHSLNSKVTDNPIEDGSSISDHIIKLPRRFSMEGIVSNTPITLLGSAAGTAFGLTGFAATEALPGVAGAVAITAAAIATSKAFQGAPNALTVPVGTSSAVTKTEGDTVTKTLTGFNVGKPSKNVFNHFQIIYENKIPLKIVSGLETYEPMIMETFEPESNRKTGDSLRFKASFKEIRKVKSVVESIPAVVQDPKEETKKDKGDKDAVKSTESVKEKGKGTISNLFDTGSAFFKSLFQSIGN